MNEVEAGEVPVSEDLTKRLMTKARAGEVPGPLGSGSWCQHVIGVGEVPISGSMTERPMIKVHVGEVPRP
ncbi:hypothetical protein DSO57_1025942 [Entomophthora muscae]|uniref:Uncharacterized protein n=1 Tax=Entomophthora muscae TaxID=34485 RepID=A0ACC2T291_9FUNG|nr:hypothetical protein DSO57_1025942 [Entomophthora muscae]